MKINMFSGIFRGRKTKNREKSQFFTCLVEAAGVFCSKNYPSRHRKKFLKSRKNGLFSTCVTSKNKRKNSGLKFFGDFSGILSPHLAPFWKGGVDVDIY